MANRFLDTNFYKSPYVRGLKGPLKALYGFIICDCTPCGFWAKDLEISSLYIGFTVTEDEFQESFVLKDKAVDLGGGKYFFPDFIEHQYPAGLQSWNKAHSKIIMELEKYDFLSSKVEEKGTLFFIKKKAPPKGLQSPQGNGKGNNQGQGSGQGNADLPQENLLCPEMLVVYKKSNPNHPESDADYKPLYSIAGLILKQTKNKGTPVENKAIIIKKWEQLCSVISNHDFYRIKSLSVISNHFSELYQILEHGTGTSTNKHSTNGSKFTVGAEKLLAKGNQTYAAIRGNQSGSA